MSYGAHFRLKKLTGKAPRVMPLEGLWWVDDPAQQDIVAAVARGEVTMAGSDRGIWRWQALRSKRVALSPVTALDRQVLPHSY